MNLSLYRAFAQPAVRALASAPAAQWMQSLHPLRLQYELCSDANPLMASLGRLAQGIQEYRCPIADDNPFIRFQEMMSQRIVTLLDSWRDARDAWAEQMFFAIYGSLAVQAFAGVDLAAAHPMRKAGKSRLHNELLQARIAELKSRIPIGGLREALIRSLLYIGTSRGSIDERGFEIVRRIRRSQVGMPHLSLSAFKALVREQYFMLLIDQEASLAAIPSMLPPEREGRANALDLLRQALSARGEISGEAAERLRRIYRLFGVDMGRATFSAATALANAGKVEDRKAS
jgi:hypothetical protein